MGRPVPQPPREITDERIFYVLNNAKRELIISRAAIVLLFVSLCFGALIAAKQKAPQTVYVTNTVEVIQWRTNLVFHPLIYTNTNLVVEGQITLTNVITPFWQPMSQADIQTLRALAPEADQAHWESLTDAEKLDAR